MALSQLKIAIIGTLLFLGIGMAEIRGQSPRRGTPKPDTTRQDKTSVRNQHSIKNTDTIPKRERNKEASRKARDMYLVPDTTRGKRKK